MEKVIYLTEKEIRDLCDNGYLYEPRKDEFRFLDKGFEDLVVKSY